MRCGDIEARISGAHGFRQGLPCQKLKTALLD
jgi:hypothetical protein